MLLQQASSQGNMKAKELLAYGHIVRTSPQEHCIRRLFHSNVLGLM